MNIRKMLASISMATMLLSTMGLQIALAGFKDVPEDHWAFSYVEQLVADGVVDEGDYFYPDRTLNRAELVKIAVTAGQYDIDTSGGPSFDDVSSSAWYYQYVETAAKNGIVMGYADEAGNPTGKFGPGDAVNRAQAMKILINTFGVPEQTCGAGSTFPDVADGAWYESFVETGYYWSVIDGYSNGNFGPSDNVTRAQIAKIAVMAQSPTERASCNVVVKDSDSDGVADDVDNCPYTANATQEDGDNDGVGDACTDEDRDGDDIADGSDNCPDVANADQVDTDADGAGDACDAVVVTVGDLTVSMGTVVANNTIPKGATAVKFLNVNLTAGAEADVKVSSLVFHRTGVGSVNDFSNVYLYNGDERLTSGKSISSDTNEAEFNNLGVTVPAGESVELSVKADTSTSATTGDQNAFEFTGVDKIDSSAETVNLSGALVGGYMQISGSTAGTITIAKNGSISNPKVGETNVKIAEFQLTAANEDMTLQKVALVVKGSVSASADLSNFKLYQSTTEIATDDAVNKDDVMTFSLATPYTLKKGDNRNFYVYADISSKADANDTIQVYMEEDTDLLAVGLVYGYGSQVSRNNYDGDQTTDSDGDGTVPDSSNSTLEGGQVTIAFNGPVAADVALNGKDVTFMKLNLSTQRNIDVKKMTLSITAAGANTTTGAANLWNSTSTVANFTDIKIIDADSGNTLMGPRELTATTSVGAGDDLSQTLNFTDSWTLAAGTSKNLAVTMDIANQTAISTEVFYVTLAAVSQTEGIRDVDAGGSTYITDIVPSSAIQGNNMTVRTASLTIGLASSPVSDTFVKGSTNVPSVGFTFTAGTAGDVFVTDVVLQGYFDENVDGTYGATGTDNSKSLKDTVPSVDLYDANGNKISSVTKNVSSTGSATFSGLTWTIKAGATEKLEVRATSLSTTAPQNSTNDRFSFDVSSVTAQKKDDGSAITVTPGSPNGGATPTKIVTVSSAGSLVIANADNVVTDSKVVAGVNGVLVSKFKATATDEDFMITKSNYLVSNLSSGTTNDVEQVYLVYTGKDGKSVTSSKEVVTGTSPKLANFTNMSFYVPKDKTVEFSVYMDTDTIESGSSISGDRIRIDFDATDATDEFEAIGQSSGSSVIDSVTSGDLDVSNGNHVGLYKTVPTFATNTTSSGCPTNSTKPTSGTNNLYCFDVTADANGAVDLYQVALQVAGSSITPGTLSLYDYADQSTVLDTAAVSSNVATFTLSAADTISAGGKVTYIVKGSLTIDTSAQNNSISTRVQDDTSFASNAAAASVSGNTVWSDRSATSHGLATTDWTNGYKATGLPTDQISMSL
ncbi:S-layer homology domain-containing protein [Candidatus Peregrinibacteria bacterium]|nr:S-layer homology domain-containing protein [Candidatus Peregrinibacteria bacterium]